jgi:ERCC4-type nuclease
MKIIIDNRENSLYEKIKTADSTVEKRQLNLGDIILEKEDGSPFLIIERKAIPDLLASIKDGRYEEQSFRLMHSIDIPRHHIFYFIEGGMAFLSGAERKLVYSAMTSLSVFKGFSVIKTMNLQETADIILSLSEKSARELEKGKIPYFLENSISQNISDNSTSDIFSLRDLPKKNYTDVIKSVKKDNITRENIGEILLSQIPGFSTATARTVLAKFDGSFPKLILALQDPDTESILKDIVLENGKKDEKKGRKISKTCIANLFNFIKIRENEGE